MNWGTRSNEQHCANDDKRYSHRYPPPGVRGIVFPRQYGKDPNEYEYYAKDKTKHI